MYLIKSQEIRHSSCDNLIIVTDASTQSVARWVKETLAGVDTAVFKSHSVWGASTSKLFQLHTPITEIMKKADWKSECTVKKYNNKDVLPRNISHKILTNFLSKK